MGKEHKKATNMTNLIKKYRDLSFHKKLDRFALSPLSFALQFLIASLTVYYDYQLKGVALFGYIIIAILLLCSDLLALCLPLLLCSIFATSLYDSAAAFMSFIIPEAIALVISIIFHFIVYEKKFRFGKSFSGLLAVSVAVTFSGIGSLSIKEYFTPSALYYTFFLGFGLLLIYVLINAYYKESDDYDIYEKFASIMYVMGIFAALNVLSYYIDFISGYESVSKYFDSPMLVVFQASNNLSTFLLFALPFPFYFSIKKSRFHLFSALLMFACLLLAGSGGGLLMGCALMVICIIFMAIYDKKLRFLWIGIILLTLCGGLTAFRYLLEFYKLESFGDLFIKNYPRINLFNRSLTDFKEHPVFGAGLTHRGNTDIYNPKEGAMTWYHMMLPQIWGSMGTVGILAYLYNFIVRGYLVWKARRDVYSMTLFLSYVGLFLMSQVNPGEFCPIPYALLAILLFTFIERKPKDHIPFNKQK